MTREDMQIMTARGIRGATSVEENTRQSILSNTRELLPHMMQANGFNVEDLVCAFFTTTQDRLNPANLWLTRRLKPSGVSISFAMPLVYGSLVQSVNTMKRIGVTL